MIPKIIHYCWFGKNKITDEIKRYIESWRKYCPDYEIIQWNEINFPVNENEYCKEAYEQKKYAFVSDYVRLKVLYQYGGFYLDTDVEIVKSLNPLRKYNVVFCESEGSIQTSTIGANKENTFIKLLLDDYTNRHFIKNDGGVDFTTNVKVITNLMKKHFILNLSDTSPQLLSHNIMVLPSEYLCAKNIVTGIIQRTSNTYAIHHFHGSWLPKYYQKARQINEYFIKKYGPIWGPRIWKIYWYIFVHKRGKIIHFYNKYIKRKKGKDLN